MLLHQKYEKGKNIFDHTLSIQGREVKTGGRVTGGVSQVIKNY